ncbi:uncharacterized protein LOC131317502 [Rhododendron vialii]|uniref:uncharacterized protein LOC131317502 n=1 Tax=Rhododendron vialii TaxID=182163 RepID=UPI0026602DEE|nr:uncharacterized protein LOC131317502 [Rhododendron vialii]
MQYLLAKLQEYGYIKFNQKDDNDNVKDLFLSHPTSGDMLSAFPRIIGVTSTERTFSAAFAFIDREKKENYTWVLENLKSMMDPDALHGVIVTDRELALVNAITTVFPTASHLLCRWHIGQNVYAKCRKMFDEMTWALFKHAWDSLMYSPTISLYEQALRTMKREFVLYQVAIKYIETNWDEAKHSKLKSHIANCQVNLSAAWAKMHELVKLQITDIKATFEKSLNCWQHEFRIPTFDHLRGAASQSAMGLMLPEIKKLDDMVVEDKIDCGCPIRRTHGLPCAHEIAPLKNQGEPIPLSLIDDQWKILKPILNPSTTSLSSPQQKAQTCGRKSGLVNKSMHRNPSEFEYVEASLKTPKMVKEKTFKVKATMKKSTKVTGIEGANKLLYRLSFFEDGCAPENRWMIFPNMGHVVSSTYNVVVILLSQLQCLSFLPLHSHFIQIELKACSPMPPIANYWFKFRWEEAKEWKTSFIDQIEVFKAIIESDVATAESFDVN